MKLQRGWLYTADLNPRFGAESGKLRPVLILQTDLINSDHPSTIICPLTTKVRPDVGVLRVHLRRGEAGLNAPSDLMMDQVRAIDNRRFTQVLGKLTPARLREVEEKILVLLDLEV